MSTLAHLVTHVRAHPVERRTLPIASAMVFFFVLFDGVLAYLTPIVITDLGYTPSVMGMIIGSSSVAGMLFDLLLCRFLPDTNFRRVFLLMFIFALAFPVFLLFGGSLWLLCCAMIVWGLYYDLYNVGTLDLVGRTSDAEHHASRYGVLRVFDGLGYLLAPLFASVLLATALAGYVVFMIVASILVLAILAYTFLLTVKEHHDRPLRPVRVQLGIIGELGLWRRIGVVLAPVLVFSFFLNLIDATYWTIGPLFSESLGDGSSFDGGLFMLVYTLPPLFVGWLIGRWTRRLGKKHTAYLALGAGSLMLLLLHLVSSLLLTVLLGLLAAVAFAIAWPAIGGAYADYVAEAPDIEKEIATIQDTMTNLGNVIGPVVAGIGAEYFGYQDTFALVGMLGLLAAVFLWRVTPRDIDMDRIPRVV